MLEPMWNVQRTLSRFQAVPLLGPVVGSPIKAMVSTAQIVAAFVAIIFWGSLFSITQSSSMFDRTATSLGHLTMGAAGLAYSIVNLFTLGLSGFILETNIALATQPRTYQTSWL